jgi:RNA polymerase sigma factor (sigma-70 family)
MDSRSQAKSLQAQRAAALERFLKERRRELLAHIRRHSKNPDQAEDVLAQACVQFMRFWNPERAEDPMPWMRVVSKRLAWEGTRKCCRQEGRIQTIGSSDPGDRTIEDLVEGDLLDPAESVERAEEQAHIVALIEQLKPDERTALLLLGLGCTYAEIGALQGWTYTKVNRCIAEGREAVRRRLGEGES